MRASTIAPILAALLLTACGGGSTDLAPLQEDLDAQAAAQLQLRERISELEDQLGLVASDTSGGTEALDALDERLTALDEAIAELDSTLATERTAREDATAESTAAMTALEKLLRSLQDTLDVIQSDLQRLREDHEVLKRRVDRHLEDHQG